MDWFLDWWGREPVVITTVAVALVDAAVVFGAPLEAEQKTAIVTLITALGAAIARSRVRPV